jgi:hypothetical protein
VIIRCVLAASTLLAPSTPTMATRRGAIRAGRALEELRHFWFEEPVHCQVMGEVARALDITVSAREQTYTLQGVAEGWPDAGDVHRTSVTAGPPTTGIADGTHLGIRNEAMELDQRHGPTDRNACALRR